MKKWEFWKCMSTNNAIIINFPTFYSIHFIYIQQLLFYTELVLFFRKTTNTLLVLTSLPLLLIPSKQSDVTRNLHYIHFLCKYCTYFSSVLRDCTFPCDTSFFTSLNRLVEPQWALLCVIPGNTLSSIKVSQTGSAVSKLVITYSGWKNLSSLSHLDGN